MLKIKNILLSLATIVPYLLSVILLFFSVVHSEGKFHEAFVEIHKATDFNNFQVYAFSTIIIIILSLIIFLILFLILKGIVILFDKQVFSIDKALFFSISVSLVLTNLIALLLIDSFSVNIEKLRLLIPVIDICLFSALYYSFSKNKKITLVLFVAKLMIALTGLLIK